MLLSLGRKKEFKWSDAIREQKEGCGWKITFNKKKVQQ